MTTLVFPDDFFQEYLRLKFPGKFVVCVADSDDKDRNQTALDVLNLLFVPELPNDRWFQLYNAGYALIVCDTLEEGLKMFEHFSDETIMPYVTLFGPCEEHPEGTVLTENT